MLAFLRENWLWMLLPFALVLLGVGILFYLAAGGESSPFTYDVYGG